MKDILIKQLHIMFFGYALWVGFDYFTVQEQRKIELDDQIQVGEAKISKINRQLRAVREFQNDLEESKKRVKEVVTKIEELQRQLPSDIQDTVVSGTLTTYADELRMLSPDSKPKIEKDNKFYFSKEYDFEVQGTYLQTLIFYEKLERMAKTDRILNVKSLKLTPSEKADSRSRFKILKLNTVIEAYRYNTLYDPTKDI